MNDSNPMRGIMIEKVTANIGIGASGDRLDNAKELLGKLTDAKVVLTRAKKRNPTFKLRVGLEIRRSSQASLEVNTSSLFSNFATKCSFLTT